MHSPHESHWKETNRILHYVSGTKYLGLFYFATNFRDLEAYTNVEREGSIEDRKITSCYDFLFGYNMISWSSKKQPMVFLSITKP